MKKSYYWFLVFLILRITKELNDTLLTRVEIGICICIVAYHAVIEYKESRKKYKKNKI